MDRRVDASIGMQVEIPVRGRARVDRVAIAPGQELRTGRWGCEQANSAASPVCLLVHVSPHDGADMWVRIDDPPKRLRLGETYGIQPAAVHGDRVMVQT